MAENKLYYSIGEVAEMFNVNASLIRYWEQQFPVLRPRKNKKGNRQFTERDIRYIRMIYNLVKEQGYTLEGAKNALKENFDEYENLSMTLNTLAHMRNFLIELDKELAAKQKRS